MQIQEAGMRPSQVYEFIKQFYGGPKNIPFSRQIAIMRSVKNEINT
jgi:hypothetical protein